MNKTIAMMTGLAVISLISACSDTNKRSVMPVAMISYQIAITNLTHSQPLSPVGIVFHDGAYSGWKIGEPASAELETLAEGGDNASFLSSSTGFFTLSGDGVIPPGETFVTTATMEDADDVNLTLATMLVNTNDGFTGITAFSLNLTAVGESESVDLYPLDSGTEANSESAGSIPGPADAGEGFNMNRDDVDFVAGHSGVVSRDDGYPESVLTYAHRFDGPVGKLLITRMQ